MGAFPTVGGLQNSFSNPFMTQSTTSIMSSGEHQVFIRISPHHIIRDPCIQSP